MASLQKIRQVKQHKLQAAESALRTAKALLQKLKAELKAAEQECSRYQVWRIEQENKLYAEVEKKLLRLAQLDELRERISSMHKQEAKLRQETLELETKVKKASVDKTKCQQAVRKAEKDIEKYDLLIQETLEEARLIQERQSEDMLDEFASAKTERESDVDAPD